MRLRAAPSLLPQHERYRFSEVPDIRADRTGVADASPGRPPGQSKQQNETAEQAVSHGPLFPIMDEDSQPVVIIDGVCTLCDFSVQFIKKNARHQNFRFIAAQSQNGMEYQRVYGIDSLAEGTVILVKGGNLFTKSDAVLEIAKDLRRPWNYLRICAYIPKVCRDFIYSLIARNRYRWFGKKDAL